MDGPRSGHVASSNSGIYSLLSVRFVLCAYVCVDEDRAGALEREVGQKQIQLDKDRTLQAKSLAQLKA